MPKARGRFDIVAVFKTGGWVRFESDPKRSLDAAEIVDRLREYAKYIEAGVKAERKALNVRVGRQTKA